MPRAPKVCGRAGCTELTASTYCREHERDHQQHMARKRGRTAARGYGSKHQRQRKQWSPKVSTGNVTCWRCGEPIRPGEPWDLGHDDRDRNVTRGPEHANRCNRPTSGRRGAPPPPPADSA